MKPISNPKFAETVMKMWDPSRPFKPSAVYIPEGDCIEFVFAPDDYYAQRVDGLVTVYYSRQTNQIVGSLIKGVRSLCKRILERFPGFKIEIEDRPVKLEHMFLAYVWSQPCPMEEMVVRTYEKLIQVAKREDMEVDVCPAAP